MKMAKANEQDLEAANAVARILEELDKGYMPSSGDDDETEFFDRYDREQCQRALIAILDAADRGSLFRVTFGMLVLLDPRNKVVDPDADTLEIHPEHIANADAARELERTRNGAKVMERTLEDAQVEIADLKSKLADAMQDNISLLHLLALIREAVGDNGKHMQDELVTFIRDQRQGHLAHIALLKATLKSERVEADAMREALRPFADDAAEWGHVISDHRPMFWQLASSPEEAKFTVGDLRRAAALLEKS